MKIKMPKFKAFTLVEIMLAVGLLAILGLAVNSYLISMLRNARKAAINAIVKSEGEQIQANLVQTVKFAKRINSCTATSLSLLSSEGSDVLYSIVSSRLNKSIVPIAPTPTVSINLNSTKTNISGCGGTMFDCDNGGKTVNVCYVLTVTGGTDVIDTSSMTFQNYIYTNN